MSDGLPDASDESDSKNDGFLSYAAEWHALTHGVFMGYTSRPLVTPPEPENADVREEPHYYRGGYIIGTLLQLLTMAALGVGIGKGVLGL